MKRFIAVAVAGVFGVLMGAGGVAAGWTPCTGATAGYCQWGKVGDAATCYSINMGETDNLNCQTEFDKCKKDGFLYKDAACTQWNEVGEKNPNEATPGSGCCKWVEATQPLGCRDVVTGKQVTDCQQGANVYWTQSCGAELSDNSKTCPSEPPTFGNPSGDVKYCRYESSCWATTDVAQCVADYGSVYTGVPASGVGEGKACEGGTWTGEGRNPNTLVWCDYGPTTLDGGGCVREESAEKCTASSGTVVNSCGTGVKLQSAKSLNSSALRVSYKKGNVTVNWSSATKISGGTVELINAKGVTVASSLVKANSSKVAAKLGAGSVPAGMYFVRVNVRDAMGKKVVMQTPVSIVK